MAAIVKSAKAITTDHNVCVNIITNIIRLIIILDKVILFAKVTRPPPQAARQPQREYKSKIGERVVGSFIIPYIFIENFPKY